MQLYPENESDPKTCEPTEEKLERRTAAKDIMMVGDRDIIKRIGNQEPGCGIATGVAGWLPRLGDRRACRGLGHPHGACTLYEPDRRRGELSNDEDGAGGATIDFPAQGRALRKLRGGDDAGLGIGAWTQPAGCSSGTHGVAAASRIEIVSKKIGKMASHPILPGPRFSPKVNPATRAKCHFNQTGDPSEIQPEIHGDALIPAKGWIGNA